MKTNNNCTCIIGSKDNKCLVHGLIGGNDVGNEVLRVYSGKKSETVNDLELLINKQTPEEEIKQLEQVIISQQEKIVELTKQNKILNQQLFGHLKSTNY